MANNMTKRGKIVLILVIVLLVLSAAAAVTMGVLFGRESGSAQAYRMRVDSMYETTYYEAMDNMDDIETKLGKVAVLSRPALQQEYLYDVWRQCGIAVSDLSRMAGEGEDIEAVIGFLNKTGDYCYYLSRKAKEDPPSTEELANLERFKSIISEINRSLFAVQEEMKVDGKIDASILSDMSAIGRAVKNRSDVDYPELIYDGPFSDGLKKREAVFLTDKEEISEEESLQKLREYFGEIEKVEKVGESASTIPSFIYSFEKNGVSGTAQITKQGGYLSEYSSYEKVVDPQYTPQECKKLAKDFLEQVGYENMECVWVYNSDSTVYLNFAYTADGVVCYADLIKVKVSAQTGRVTGLEGQNYIYNHTERTIDGSSTEVDVTERIEVTGRRECIIPTEWGTELRCLEISGRYGEDTYYVYYDSETGEEIKAFVVVDELLI